VSSIKDEDCQRVVSVCQSLPWHWCYQRSMSVWVMLTTLYPVVVAIGNPPISWNTFVIHVSHRQTTSKTAQSPKILNRYLGDHNHKDHKDQRRIRYSRKRSESH
jgi:hypothetical protein